MAKVQHTYAVRLAVEDGGKVKAELVEIGTSGEKSLQQIEKGGKSASSGLESLTGRAKSLSGSIKLMAASALSAASIGGLALLTKRAIDSADAIAKTADNIGISTDALQELRYAADLSGVSQERFDKALQKFTIRIGEAAAGTGEAKRAFELLGVSVLDTEGRLKNTETIINQVSNALSGIENPTERARVAYNLFGREGVAMVGLLAKGSAEMETMRQRARDLGLVLDEDLLRNAEKAQDELATLHKVISANLSRALLDLSPIIADTSTFLSELAADAGTAYEKMKLFFSGDFKLEGQSLRGVTRDIKNLDESIESLQKRLGNIGSQEQQAGKLGFLIDPFHVETNRLQGEIDRLEEQRKQLQDKKGKLEADKNARAGTGDTVGAASAEAALQKLEDQAKQAESLRNTLEQQLFDLTTKGAARIEAEYQKQIDLIETLRNEFNADEIGNLLSDALEVRNVRLKQFADQEADAEKKRAEAADKRAKAEAEQKGKTVEANKKVVESLNIEIAALGKSERQNFIDQAVRRLSAEATQNQRREVELLAGALYDEKEALEEKRKEEERRKALIDDIKQLTEEQVNAQEKYNERMAELNGLLKEGAINQKEFEVASKQARDTMLQNSKEWSAGVQRALQDYADEATDMASQVQQVTTRMLQGLEDALVEFTTTGKVNWKDMVNSMISDITRLIIRTQITGPLANSLNQVIGNFFGSAQGNVFAHGMPVHAFGNGSVVFQPTIFPMAKGIGLMGEAGPEAIMPLRRLPSGRLGVEASGGGSSYMVNVDARGSADPAATARQVEQAVDRALSARIPGIVRTSAAAARAEVVDSWQRRGGRFD
ncbi:MAG: hypothetical protein HY370_04135 [Proteobacteria bacterium]|nr:hypothetical protein [Pseudomonadota bacterium]